MFGSGQGSHCAAGHAGHDFGSGHFTTGQRARGQGGHSPILQGLEHVDIQGGHFGTADLSTYLDISGIGGHSVLSMYLDISGRGGQGGTADFLIHFDKSGAGQDGQGGQRSRDAYGIPSGDELDPASAPPVAQPQGRGLWQRPHNPLIAASLGHSGGVGRLRSIAEGEVACEDMGHPQGRGLPQRLQLLPPSNFSTTLPRKRPIKYPTINMSTKPNKRIIGVTLNPEAILFSIMVFYAGRL